MQFSIDYIYVSENINVEKQLLKKLRFKYYRNEL